MKQQLTASFQDFAVSLYRYPRCDEKRPTPESRLAEQSVKDPNAATRALLALNPGSWSHAAHPTVGGLAG
jgi:hypothetical protein